MLRTGMRRRGQLTAPPATPELVARGAYLARLGDCAACHSIPGKPPYSGGLAHGHADRRHLHDKHHARPHIRDRTLQLADFDRALRFGVAKGHTLYPAMPFTSYYNTTPEDVAALYAYFQQGVPAAVVSNRPSDIPFPLSMRWPLTYWRWLFAPKPAPFSLWLRRMPRSPRRLFCRGPGPLWRMSHAPSRSPCSSRRPRRRMARLPFRRGDRELFRT